MWTEQLPKCSTTTNENCELTSVKATPLKSSLTPVSRICLTEHSHPEGQLLAGIQCSPGCSSDSAVQGIYAMALPTW